ncbi:efflux RND transporter periplasmic adaptor subunit [Aliihoeflea sp. PC F10.4]
MNLRIFNSSFFVFVAIIAVIVVWIATGMNGPQTEAPASERERSVPVVAASWSEATPVDQRMSLYGEVEPTQVVILRSRTDGLIESVASQGTTVQTGDELAQLSTDDREARLARAQAQLATAEQSHAAAQRLAERGVGPSQDVQARLAELEAARAELRAIELEIENTTLRSPIAGTVNRVISDVGAYVPLGGEVLEIVDNDPLVAVIQVQQAQVTRVRPGMAAKVSFIGGDEVDGRVTFVSPLADASTRTFRVEVEVPNPEGAFPAGLSAEVALVTRTVEAHHVSAALLRLDEQGLLGIYTVGDDDTVAFEQVNVVMADSSGIWIAGLAPRERIITISQGGIAAGEAVVVEETPPEYRQRVIAPGTQADDPDQTEPEAR